ncbi:methyltransferase domain-containing protein [Streptomyces scopuliridis]|uniref:methyltransferase domain-containing protein n=1 Tax=Streptomyces scopuliridis TaxID=452529 RepID=UPI002DD94B0D|nr:methyltransferase domain-containing protein [Streptomyces scopuliridis]WSC07340.1 methyltransferase domain-containing protein [Streptomyces scopuliridis]
MDAYARLTAGLISTGALGEGWRGAFARAPRSAFVPDTVWAPEDASPTGYRRITRGDAGAAWRELVDADGVVVTQLDDGVEGGPGMATSSASMPSLVATMLRHLDVADGHTVLDIGTGTGWTSALLTARLGDENVTTVEVDPRIAAEAAKRLKAAGFAPRCVVGDGLAGWSSGAPYDRIHSTAAVRRVPRAWIEQTRPGGIIVSPWGTPYANAGLLRLVAGDRGVESYGRFVDDVSFMWMRTQRPPRVTGPGTAPVHRTASVMDPDLALENVDVAFAIGLRVPGVRYVHTWDDADPQATYRMRLSDGEGSWASVAYQGWDSEDTVHQAGPRRLWDEITAARRWWLNHGSPELTRFGLTVATDGKQSLWLDNAAHVVG